MDKKDQIILQQLDVIRTMTENGLRRMGSDFWGGSTPVSPDSPFREFLDSAPKFPAPVTPAAPPAPAAPADRSNTAAADQSAKPAAAAEAETPPEKIEDLLAELDGYIAKYAKGWSFARIPLVASAIMRVAMYEMLYMPEIPNGAAINEAVEIAKKYETPETVKFMNGILGSFVRQEVSE